MAGFSGVLHSEQYPATVAMQCVMIVIPEGDEYVRLLASLLDIAGTPDSYDEPDSAQTDGLCFAWDEAYFETEWLDCGNPPGSENMSTELFLSPLNMNVLAGNGVTQTIATAQRFNAVYAQTAAALNQRLNAHRWLAAGDWSYRITAVKNNASGILTFEVTDADGNQAFIGTHDFYNAVAQNNQFFTGGFTLPVGGETILDFKSAAKNGASSNYQQNITCLEMWRYG